MNFEKPSAAYARTSATLILLGCVVCLIVLIWTREFWIEWALTILLLFFTAAGLSNMADRIEERE